MLPLLLGRKARAGPGGIGLGLIEADMADGRGGVDRTQAVQRHGGPTALAVRAPVERRVPAFGADPSPALGQPELRTAVAPVGHEGQPFAIGHQAVGKLERLQPGLVTRPLVVEGEVLALMPQADEPAVEADEAKGIGRRCGRRMARRRIGRRQRRLGEQVQDVHQDQFLMLLFMRQAQVDQGREIRPLIHQQAAHGGVHVRPIGDHVVQRRSGQQPAFRSRLPGTKRLVIGVEEVVEARVERSVAGQVRNQQEGLPEPGHMRQVPLRGARVGHRLGQLILGGQGAGERERRLTHGLEPMELGRARGRTRRRGRSSRRGSRAGLGMFGPSHRSPLHTAAPAASPRAAMS